MKSKILAVSFLAALSLIVFSAPVPVLAQADEVLRGVQITGAPPADEAGGGLNSLIENVINILSLVVGVASVIMIIIGGFQYVISNGEGTKVGNAKNTILYALIGLVIVAFAQIIVNFVLTDVAMPSASQQSGGGGEEADGPEPPSPELR